VRYNGIVWFLCHSTAFLYRPTSATAQMLKLDKIPVRWFSRRWRKITAIAENHGIRPINATIPIISTHLYSVTFAHDSHSHKSQPRLPAGLQVHNTQYLCTVHGVWTQVYGIMYCSWRPFPE